MRDTSNQAMTVYRAMFVVALIAMTGCGDDGATMPTDPIADRYPSARLPWALRIDDPNIAESGTVVGRRIPFIDSSGAAPWYEWKTARVAVVALDDRVVVVFPPADRVGLDIAHAGFDKPWERVPLTDLPLQDVGDIDAVRDATGTVWIAVRSRRGDMPITLYRWRPGQSVTSEPVPRVGLSSSTWFHDNCEDLALSVAPDGTIDLLYQQVYPGQGDNALIHAHRAASATTWQTDVVVYGASPWFGPPVAGRFGVVGCRTLVERDLDGSLQVATLHQRLGTQAITVGQYVAMPITPLKVFGLYRGGDGNWRRATNQGDWDAGPFFSNLDGWPEVTRGQFDLGRHPEGFLLAAPSYPFTPGSIEAFEIRGSSFLYDLVASGWERPLHKSLPPAKVDQERVGGRIVANECGGIWVFQERWSAESYLISDACCAITAAPNGCMLEPVAPVVVRDEPAGVRRHPSFARGPRPYDVATCVVGAAGDLLEICHGLGGGIGGELDRRATIVALDPPAESATLTGLMPITVRLSRARRDDETPSAVVWDVTAAGSPWVTVTAGASPDEIVVTPMTDWAPGHMYRVAAWFSYENSSPPSAHAYFDMPRPVANLRAAPSPLVPDRRTTVQRLYCGSPSYYRDTDGTCVQVHRPNANPPDYVQLLLWADDETWSAPPTLEDGAGTIIPSTYSITTSDRRVTWTVQLEDDAPYLIRFAAGTKTPLGGPLHPDDLRLRFYTASLPELVSTTPANNATGVSRTAPIEVVFDSPVTVPTNGVVLGDGMTTIPLTIEQLSPTTFRFTHAGLAPTTSHILFLTEEIRDTANNVLVGAPIMISFQTGT